jgi:hypothetical protein
MGRRGYGDGLEFLPNDRVTSPAIRERLWLLMDWARMLLNAKNYLIHQNLVGSPVPLTGYYDFAKRMFFHVRDSGYEAAVPLIQSDIELFKSWGFSATLLKSLALLQGVIIET